MVFTPPTWAPTLPQVPDNIPISEFMLNESHGRYPLNQARDPFTCGFTGKSYSASQVVDRVEHLTRGLAKELGWKPNEGSEWDKVLGIFCYNTIDTLPLSWAVHQLGGLVTPANAVYSGPELKYQLQDAKPKALFTSTPLLPAALEAASLANFPKDKIYLIDLPPQMGNSKTPPGYKTLAQIEEAGKSLPKVEKLNWKAGEAARRTAFLCYSSGTSGLPKGVMISHRNVIANVLQLTLYEKKWRQSVTPAGKPLYTDVSLGLLPQSHIYALVATCHTGVYRGDQIVVLPKFEMKSYLEAIQNFKISCLFVVPPIIINMLRNKDQCTKYDLSSVSSLYTGAAPLGPETVDEYLKIYPGVSIKQAYGLTETSTVVCSTHPEDFLLGSSGCLMPGAEVRILSPEGQEIKSYDTPGELVVRSPSVVLGYLNNDKATKETFRDGWMHTGDEAVIRQNPKTKSEHIFIVDRIKELIKVKGLQVAPAELEAHLLTHPAVADCAVVAIPDDAAGEVPKAIVVKSAEAGPDDAATTQAIKKHVEEHKARHKWLKGGVRFIDAVPKSPSGKILRRLLRDQEKEALRKSGPRL
ncbi:hypothetical protein SI65_09024 [Aspergillus cristatus]|uniref:Phenylacetyl-CoA ligase n=1 Tax=Aspergillus cristatus TaxID=573508 RepID=A0A1E3B3L8_ASPCR|nr:hypothetical protein SI65_09024 [Aspergillus cristatus]